MTSQIGLLLIQNFKNQMSSRRYWSRSGGAWYAYRTRWEELQGIGGFAAMATFSVRAFID